jgi:NADPH-dependent curcumin reductase CurA
MIIFIEIGFLAVVYLSSYVSTVASLLLGLLLVPLLFVQQKGSLQLKRNSQNISSRTMKAVIYDPSTKSGLNFSSKHSLPKYTSNQVLLKIVYAAINPVDYKLVAPNIPFVRWSWPDTVGRDISGIVIEVGSNVKNFRLGDKVFGKALGGALQEYTVADSDEIALLPERRRILNL